MTIQLKAAEQYLPVVLLISLRMWSLLSVTIQVKATEQCFPIILLVFLGFCKVLMVLFQGVDDFEYRSYSVIRRTRL